MSSQVSFSESGGQTHVPVLAGAYMTQDDDYLTFQRDFDEHFKNLTDAMAKSQSVGSMASSVEKKSTLGMLWGSLNGDNDKEFAQMAGDLAASLTTTQVVLQVIMQLNHRKNGLLKDFHHALVSKIGSIVNDTQTLDTNQREATLVVLEQLRSHVESRIEQEELIQQNNKRLEHLGNQTAAFRTDIDTFRHRLSQIDATTQALHRQDGESAALLEVLRSHTAEQAMALDTQAKHIEGSRQEIARLETLITTQAVQIDDLVAATNRATCLTERLLRHVIPIAALTVAAVALLKASGSLGG
ncbi:hypothetical protein [Achromobacter kerstersii]|uniref:hypothetical protein n=1 Tax=Achromobacter kerstersii TaxID=1353890 RepID=UPI0006BFC2F6|nr:hypothetical protein [Achromobacter kerstersii]CUI73664.1 Uncharacterised protein [Achromobacter kerstersii]